MAIVAQSVGSTIGNAISNIGNYSAQAASRANAVSKLAQSAQGIFNQNSADLANLISDQRIAEQYQYNAAQAAAANEFTEAMWNKTAQWNEAMWDKSAAYNQDLYNQQKEWNEIMWNKQASFNSEEAEKNREWQKNMMETSYQRAVADMQKAGLNPILAATSGINPNVGSGSLASVGGTSIGGSSLGTSSMSSAQGAMANGGLLQGNQASESNYTGQMEYLSGTLGLISAVVGGVSSALKGLGSLGDIGKGLGESIASIFKNPLESNPLFKEGEKINDYMHGIEQSSSGTKHRTNSGTFPSKESQYQIWKKHHYD